MSKNHKLCVALKILLRTGVNLELVFIKKQRYWKKWKNLRGDSAYKGYVVLINEQGHYRIELSTGYKQSC